MRILLIEDERKVASFVARALREESYAVDISDTGPDGLERALGTSYDAILLDIRLPGLSGIEVCSELREKGIEAPILMLTARTLIEQRVEGLDAGADDYLTKPFAVAELRARVRALIRRGFNKSSSRLQWREFVLDRHRRCVKRGTEDIHLTSKEFALLEFLLIRAPETVTRTEIIEHVWNSNFDSGTNLVDVYINRLREKLGHSPSAELIHTVRGVGYSLRQSD
jgi:DNA-binding response OmpR family regulator